MSVGIGGNISKRALTVELRRLAGQVIDITPDDGSPITREQKLAELVWKQALGWVERYRDDDGTLKEKFHPPVAWAQQFIFERTEGKAPQAVNDDTGSIKALDRVRELNRSRINALAASAMDAKPAIPQRPIRRRPEAQVRSPGDSLGGKSAENAGVGAGTRCDP